MSGDDPNGVDGGDRDGDPGTGGSPDDSRPGGDDGHDESPGADDGLRENDGDRFGRLPATESEREVAGRPTREAVLEWWNDRFGIDPGTFADHTFWEKGSGKLWAYRGEPPAETDVEAIGMTVLRVRQEHWKPTTDAVQRFGREATENVIVLDADDARRFAAGEEIEVEWDGDWGYLIAAHEVAGRRAPIGVGRYTYGTLDSMVPKGRQRDL